MLLAVLAAFSMPALAKMDSKYCESVLSPHAAFITEELIANGRYPQMNAGIRSHVLAYLLQHLSVPVEAIIQPVSEADVDYAAIIMDRVHVAMGLPALSYRSLDESITIPEEKREFKFTDADILEMAGKIRGVEPAKAEQYIRTVMDHDYPRFIRCVQPERLRNLLTSATYSAMANLLEAVVLLSPESKPALGNFTLRVRMLEQLPEAAAKTTEFLAQNPELVEKLAKFGRSIKEAFDEPELKELAMRYRENLQHPGKYDAHLSSWNVRNTMGVFVERHLVHDFPDLPVEKIRAWIDKTDLFRA
jgi:hypothetical protein